MNGKNVLVIGAAGALGTLICDEVQKYAPELTLFLGDYRPERGRALAASRGVDYRLTDLGDASRLESALRGMDIVILAAAQKEPLVQEVCLRLGIHCVDVVVSFDFCERIKRLYANARAGSCASVLMAGFFPGLSGLLLKDAIASLDEVQSLDLALIQSSNATAGRDGVADMLDIISQPVTTSDESGAIPGFRRRRSFSLADGRLVYPRRIAHSEQRLLSHFWNTSLRYWTCWDSIALNVLLLALLRLRLLVPLARGIRSGKLPPGGGHKAGKSEEAVLLARAQGLRNGEPVERNLELRVFADYGATARTAVALARLCLTESWNGALYPFEAADLARVLRTMDPRGIELIRA